MAGSEQGTGDVVEFLRRDHDRIRSLLVHAASGTRDQRWLTFSQLSELVIRHEVAEELVVYPELADLPGGAAVSGSRIEDQSAIEDLLVALDREVFESAAFQKDSVRLGAAVLGHLEKEDAQVLPLLATTVGSRRRTELGRRFLEVVGVAPARRQVGAGVPTGPAIVDRTSAVSIFMRDAAAVGRLAS